MEKQRSGVSKLSGGVVRGWVAVARCYTEPIFICDWKVGPAECTKEVRARVGMKLVAEGNVSFVLSR